MGVSTKKQGRYLWRGKVQAATYVTPEDYDAFQAIAAENDRSLAGELRRVIKDHIAAHVVARDEAA